MRLIYGWDLKKVGLPRMLCRIWWRLWSDSVDVCMLKWSSKIMPLLRVFSCLFLLTQTSPLLYWGQNSWLHLKCSLLHLYKANKVKFQASAWKHWKMSHPKLDRLLSVQFRRKLSGQAILLGSQMAGVYIPFFSEQSRKPTPLNILYLKNMIL